MNYKKSFTDRYLLDDFLNMSDLHKKKFKKYANDYAFHNGNAEDKIDYGRDFVKLTTSYLFSLSPYSLHVFCRKYGGVRQFLYLMGTRSIGTGELAMDIWDEFKEDLKKELENTDGYKKWLTDKEKNNKRN